MNGLPGVLESVPSAESRPLVPLARWSPWVLSLYWLLIFAGTHYPREPHLFHSGVSDKWMHFGAYFGLAFLLAAVARLRGIGGRWLMLKVIAIAALYGAFDEISQPLVGRDCELLDWCADLAGATLGSGTLLTLAAFVGRERPAQ